MVNVKYKIQKGKERAMKEKRLIQICLMLAAHIYIQYFQFRIFLFTCAFRIEADEFFDDEKVLRSGIV